MIGKKIYKNDAKQMAEYVDVADWCNIHDAHIEDKGTYYEVCENIIPEPTKEEKLNSLDTQYDSDKAEIMRYYNEAVFAGDTKTQDELRAEMAEIDAQYVEDRKAIEEE